MLNADVPCQLHPCVRYEVAGKKRDHFLNYLWSLKMKFLAKKVQAFFADEQGVTAVEYGLMAALIAGVIVVAVALVGTNLTAIFNFIAGKLTTPAT